MVRRDLKPPGIEFADAGVQEASLHLSALKRLQTERLCVKVQQFSEGFLDVSPLSSAFDLFIPSCAVPAAGLAWCMETSVYDHIHI